MPRRQPTENVGSGGALIRQSRRRRCDQFGGGGIVTADILSGFLSQRCTEDGLRYILVLSDYFTKWACAFALPDAEASTCMHIMYDGFLAQFGQPNQLHTDPGRNFESKLFYEMCQLTRVVKTRTTPFRPQSDRTNEHDITANVKMYGR